MASVNTMLQLLAFSAAQPADDRKVYENPPEEQKGSYSFGPFKEKPQEKKAVMQFLGLQYTNTPVNYKGMSLIVSPQKDDRVYVQKNTQQGLNRMQLKLEGYGRAYAHQVSTVDTLDRTDMVLDVSKHDGRTVTKQTDADLKRTEKSYQYGLGVVFNGNQFANDHTVEGNIQSPSYYRSLTAKMGGGGDTFRLPGEGWMGVIDFRPEDKKLSPQQNGDNKAVIATVKQHFLRIKGDGDDTVQFLEPLESMKVTRKYEDNDDGKEEILFTFKPAKNPADNPDGYNLHGVDVRGCTRFIFPGAKPGDQAIVMSEAELIKYIRGLEGKKD